jgi:hypothetical protein
VVLKLLYGVWRVYRAVHHTHSSLHTRVYRIVAYTFGKTVPQMKFPYVSVSLVTAIVLKPNEYREIVILVPLVELDSRRGLLQGNVEVLWDCYQLALKQAVSGNCAFCTDVFLNSRLTRMEITKEVCSLIVSYFYFLIFFYSRFMFHLYLLLSLLPSFLSSYPFSY